MLYILILALIGISACTPYKPSVDLTNVQGYQEPDMSLSNCWVQPPRSDKWYPCHSIPRDNYHLGH